LEFKTLEQSPLLDSNYPIQTHGNLIDNPMSKMKTLRKLAEQKLLDCYERNGCLRVPDLERRKKEPRTYKMGYEIRLVARNQSELSELRRAIRAVGFKPGKPFSKVNQWVQPIYGREAMECFIAMFDKSGLKPTRKREAGKPKGKSKNAANG
jgi:hypothetical protein